MSVTSIKFDTASLKINDQVFAYKDIENICMTPPYVHHFSAYYRELTIKLYDSKKPIVFFVGNRPDDENQKEISEGCSCTYPELYARIINDRNLENKFRFKNFSWFSDAKIQLENIINIEPETLMNIRLCGFWKFTKKGLRIRFRCVILTAMKEVPVRHPTRSFLSLDRTALLFLWLKKLFKRKEKNNAVIYDETEPVFESQNARQKSVWFGMFFCPDSTYG